MFPALLMLAAISRMVHHTNPCCRNFEQYFCLPRIEEATTHQIPIRSVRIDPIGTSWIETPDPWRQPRNYIHPDYDKGFLDREAAMDISLEREDPLLQTVPAEHVNTENEIIVITGNEHENEDYLARSSELPEEPTDFLQKYDIAF